MKMAIVVGHVELVVGICECDVRARTAEVVLQAIKGTELGSAKAHAGFVAQIISLPND